MGASPPSKQKGEIADSAQEDIPMISMMNAPQPAAAAGVSNAGGGAGQFLEELPIFHDLPRGALHALALSCHAVKFPAGRRIVSEGAAGTTTYLVRAGWAKRCRSTPGGGTILFDVIGEGEMVGLASAVDSGPYMYTAMALRDLDALAIPNRTLISLFGRFPEFWHEFSRLVAHDLRETTNRQVYMSGNVPERLACAFERLARSSGANGAPLRLPKLLSRQEIAEMAGTTPETAIRILSRWKKSGLLVTEKDAFVILNPSELAELASHAGWKDPSLPAQTNGVELLH